MADFFTNQPTGALLLQSAQALIALNRQRKAQEAEAEARERNFELQERNLDIREKNADIQQRFADLQTKRLELENDPKAQEFRQRIQAAETREAEAKARIAEQKSKLGPQGKTQSVGEALRILETTQERMLNGLLFSKAGEIPGFSLTAGDSIASLRVERAELLEKEGVHREIVASSGITSPEGQEARRALDRLASLNSILQDPEFINAEFRIRQMSPTDQAVFNQGAEILSQSHQVPPQVASDGLRQLHTLKAQNDLNVTNFLPNVTPETFGSAAVKAAQGDTANLKALLIQSGRLGGTNAGITEFLQRLTPFFSQAGLTDEQIRAAQINLINDL